MIPINHTRPVSGADRSPVVPAARKECDSVGFKNAELLHQLLQETPDIRPEAVARGKALLADQSYPPKETLQRIAELLANNLRLADD